MNREHVVGCPALRSGVRCVCQIEPPHSEPVSEKATLFAWPSCGHTAPAVCFTCYVERGTRLAAAERDGICKDVSIKMLQDAVLAARQALAAAEAQRDEAMEVLTRFGNVDKAAEIASLVAALAAARRDGICKDVSIKMLQDEVLAARRALERIIAMCDVPSTCACGRPNGLLALVTCAQVALAPERPRKERG